MRSRHRSRAAIVALLLAVVSRAADVPPSETVPETLAAVSVTGQRYAPVPMDLPANAKLSLGWRLGPPPDFPTFMDTLVVTASRTTQLPQRVAATAHRLNAETVRALPVATLDSALRSIPSFSLFRRSDSLTANPTTQGVSLRGLGPSGASRSLVLLDGVPLNDPFGGWVTWSQIPRDAISRVEVVPGGGASAWGNAALGGVLQVFLERPKTALLVVDQPPAPLAWGSRGTAHGSVVLGDFGTRNASVVVNRPAGERGVVQVMAEDFSTDGFSVVAPESRGPVDTAAWSRHRSLAATWRQLVRRGTEVSVTVRSFEEFRGNGTAFQRNGTRSKFAAVQAAGQPSEAFNWNAVAYAQGQSFASTFSSIDATRTTETPASDQYAVPASALGASWTGTWVHGDVATTGFGIDARTVHGETREFYSYASNAFARERVAGASQSYGGLFVVQQQRVTRALRLTLGGRMDGWADENGHRREQIRASGQVTRNDTYPGRDGTEFSPSLGAIWTVSPAWRLRANAQQSFRHPTLNELYRPFRQGPNVTEANAALRTEHVTSAEVAAEWSLWPRSSATLPAAAEPQPRRAPLLTFSTTAFWNDLRDAVTNVTVAHGPGVFPLFGNLAADGVGRQRLNVDRIRVAGTELALRWTPTSAFTLTAAYLYNEATVRRAQVAPDLVGKRLAEVPRHSASLGATYRVTDRFSLTSRWRWIGRQFDDDENSLQLGEVVVADVGATRRLNRTLELFVTLENAGNARVETARSASGVVNIGTPRLLLAGLRAAW